MFPDPILFWKIRRAASRVSRGFFRPGRMHAKRDSSPLGGERAELTAGCTSPTAPLVDMGCGATHGTSRPPSMHTRQGTATRDRGGLTDTGLSRISGTTDWRVNSNAKSRACANVRGARLQ